MKVFCLSNATDESVDGLLPDAFESEDAYPIQVQSRRVSMNFVRSISTAAALLIALGVCVTISYCIGSPGKEVLTSAVHGEDIQTKHGIIISLPGDNRATIKKRIHELSHRYKRGKAWSRKQNKRNNTDGKTDEKEKVKYNDEEYELAPVGRFETGKAPYSGASAVINLPLLDHGGPIMTDVPPVYFIYYGTQFTTADKSLLENFANGLSSSAWMKMTASYPRKMASSFTFNGSVSSTFAGSSVILETDIANIVAKAFADGLSISESAIYVVLTSKEVNVLGFCKDFCGWHSYGIFSSKKVKYVFVGDPSQCITSCSAQSTFSPNNNPGIDAAASIIAHEVTETISDPLLNAFYSRVGYENADICAWSFGTSNMLDNGAYYNVDFGTNGRWLIQRNVVIGQYGQFCQLSLDAGAAVATTRATTRAPVSSARRRRSTRRRPRR